MKNKVILAVFALSLIFPAFVFGASFKTGAYLLVDGKSNPTNVVVSNRNPVFSWEFTGGDTAFTVKVSSSANLSSPLWVYSANANSQNTPNLVKYLPYNIFPDTTVPEYNLTRVKYNEDNAGVALIVGTTYYFEITLVESGVSASKAAQFCGISASVQTPGAGMAVAIDQNNPFNPKAGQSTTIRYSSNDADRRAKIRIFSASGDLVMEWPEKTILKDSVETQIWDGKNYDGEVVARGIYIVSLIDPRERGGVSCNVCVLK